MLRALPLLAFLLPAPVAVSNEEPAVDVAVRTTATDLTSRQSDVFHGGDVNHLEITVSGARWSDPGSVSFTVDVDLSGLPPSVEVLPLEGITTPAVQCAGSDRRYACTGVVGYDGAIATSFSFRAPLSVPRDVARSQASYEVALRPGTHRELDPGNDRRVAHVGIAPERRFDLQARVDKTGVGRAGDTVAAEVSIANHGPDKGLWIIDFVGFSPNGFTLVGCGREPACTQWHRIEPGVTQTLTLTFKLNGQPITGHMHVSVLWVDPQRENNRLPVAHLIRLESETPFRPVPPVPPQGDPRPGDGPDRVSNPDPPASASPSAPVDSPSAGPAVAALPPATVAMAPPSKVDDEPVDWRMLGFAAGVLLIVAVVAYLRRRIMRQ